MDGLLGARSGSLNGDPAAQTDQTEATTMLRSMLFTPGNQPRRVAKALAEIPADAVILDLEDAVPIAAKEATRAAVAAALAIPRRTTLYVRVNGVETPWFFGDLEAVVRRGLDGVMLPKTASVEMLLLADRHLSHLEAERGLPRGSVDLLPLIESAEGVANLREICTTGLARVKRLGFGAADYTADVGATWTAGEEELLLPRAHLVLYSRLGRLEPPIDTVYPHFHDPQGFEASSRRARQLGFQGRMCIHPDQVEAANRIFSPTPEEIAWAQEVIAAFREAEAQGVGAIAVRDQLIDYAFVARARRILSAAAAPRPEGGARE
jgi:citrate lyase subunit beta/citryl-CoA lyase